jgi:hypothetical protein
MSFADALASVSGTLDGLLEDKETRRQRITGDTQFFEPLVIIFELVVPPGGVSVAGQSILFPLTLAPQGMSLSEPFTVEATPTQRSGLFVEESGIVQRRMRIRGTTGFDPIPIGLSYDSTTVPPAGSGHGRSLPPIISGSLLSGQRHFQALQDRIFRSYSDFKRDPSTASATRMYVHDMQNDEHWLVAPMSFGVDRSSQSPTTYPYDIDLLILDKAKPLPLPAILKDRSLLAAMGNLIKSTQAFLSRANAAVNDLTAVQSELSLAVHNVGSTLNQVASLVGAVGNFVSGTTELVRSPYQGLFAIAQACENVLVVLDRERELGNTLANWPRPIEQRFRSLTTAAEQLGLTPRAFVPAAGTLQRQLQVLPTQAPSGPPLSSFAAINQQGSIGLPSEASIASARTQLGQTLADYPYTTQVIVRQGDSLTSLAASLFGDSRAWSLIAAANNLSPPIMPTAPAGAVLGPLLGSTLRIGQALLIPSQTAPASVLGNAAVLGATPELDPQTQTLGVDLRTVIDARGQRDLALGSSDGLADFDTVAGEDNFEQAMRARVTIEQGSAPLYPSLGLPALVGTRQAAVTWQQLQLRVQQTLLADPRVASVLRVGLATTLDGAGIDVSVQRVGSSAASQLTIAA